MNKITEFVLKAREQEDRRLRMSKKEIMQEMERLLLKFKITIVVLGRERKEYDSEWISGEAQATYMELEELLRKF